MKRTILKSIVSAVLAFVMIFSLVLTSAAAPSRNKGNVKYLSEVALIEAKDQAEADNLLAELKKEENGAFDGMISLDLNKGGKTKVYLVYKTSTNVDDAITDLSVMNMNGNYTVGNYEQLLSKTIDGYKEITADYRTMAAEFKKNYDEGHFSAAIAYRQMNYYYIERGETKINMGDYMLNFPEEDDEFCELLFRGNLNIIANIRALMAMSVGNTDVALIDRISAAFASAVEDPSVYENASYESTAEIIKNDLAEMKKIINTTESEIEQLKEQVGLTDEEVKAYQDDPASFDERVDEMSDEEIDKLTYNALIMGRQKECDLATSLYELLCEIDMGDTTLGDYVMNTAVLEVNTLFPIVAAASEGEALLMKYGDFDDLLLYDFLEEDIDIIDAELKLLEEEYEPISVYHGVQNDLTEGSIGVTGEADMFSSASGKSFMDIYGNGDTQGAAIGYTLLGVAGVASLIGGIGFLASKISGEYSRIALQKSLDNLKFKFDYLCSDIPFQEQYYTLMVPSPDKDKALMKIINAKTRQANYEMEIASMTDDLATMSKTKLTAAQIFAGSFLVVAGAVAMGVSIWQLTKIYNKYETTYTEIPNNMVHVVSSDVHGDRFVNYKNVPAYYLKDGKMQSRENDLNAYDGNQWVSLYYTKNYEAGYCLTSTPDLIATGSARAGYTGIHQFGRTSNYNLNSYCDREGAEAVYLAFKYSTNQKSAVTDVPEVVGSIFSTGIAILCGVGGAIAGVGGTLGTQRFLKKKKSNLSNSEVTEEGAENS